MLTNNRIAIIGAGVSGLTCGVLFAEQGHRVSIFADESGQQTTSAAAGAIWYPYDAEPREKVIAWALETRAVLVHLAQQSRTGVSLVALQSFCAGGEIPIPAWAAALGAKRTERSRFVMEVPLTDTSIYLDYLAKRFRDAGGALHCKHHIEKIAAIDPSFELVINCAGFGAKRLVNDADLEPHRGQVVIVPKIGHLTQAIVCDEPLTYLIPRATDCLFGGTNELSEDRRIDVAATARIVARCSRVLGSAPSKVLAERVGIRPFRKSGVRLERESLGDGRTVIHNYGHGGSGFTLSWGCAEEVFALARNPAR